MKLTKGLNVNNSNEAIVPVELKQIAYSTYKDPITNEYVVAQIKFDSETGTVGKLEVVHRDVEKTLAQERFRINVAKTLF